MSEKISKIRYKVRKFPNFLENVPDKYLYALSAVLFCITDLQICTESISFGKKSNTDYYFRMALSHIKELLSVLYKSKEVCEELIEKADSKTKEAYARLKQIYLKGGEKYYIQDNVLGRIRINNFHYPNPKKQNDFPYLVQILKKKKKLKIKFNNKKKEKYGLMDQKYQFAYELQSQTANTCLDDKVFGELVRITVDIMILGDGLLSYWHKEYSQQVKVGNRKI